MTPALNVLTYARGVERYVFLYDDCHRKDVLHTLGRFAGNAELSFTWYDAAVLSKAIREATNRLTLLGD